MIDVISYDESYIIFTYVNYQVLTSLLLSQIKLEHTVEYW